IAGKISGAGGLGSPALLYLVACGVIIVSFFPGRVGIVDHDVVKLNYLNRQVN
ncbi:hypothetical protein Pfo_007480, partial [Paulownia fortunei]